MQSIAEYYRYCPDQVEVKISDAVCNGRRRVNYPYCRGCVFNDDEIAKRSKDASKVMTPAQDYAERMERVFKAYDVRAVYPDPLDESVAWRIGHAAATFLRESLSRGERAHMERMSIVVGRDMRKSSPALCQALVSGIRATGVPVIDVGMIDTPQLYFAVNRFEAAGGIQTTASHNPAQYNGFKICGRRAIPIGENTGLADICRMARKVSPHDGSPPGPFNRRPLDDEYKAFVRRFLKPLKPMKLVVDASNGMAGKWAPFIFDDVKGLDIRFLNPELTGEFVHEPNPLVEAHLEQLRDEVRRSDADLGVCFDGDADRCVLVDENADVVRCDLLTALLAGRFLAEHPHSTVVFDLRSSRVVAQEIERLGGTARRQRVGHAFMKKLMADTNAVFGGELSGHFYFRDNAYCDSGMLALVHVLNALSESESPLSRLIQPLQRYAGSGERNYENVNKDETIDRLATIYHDAAIDRLDGITIEYDSWWFNVRKSNTEPLLRLNMEADSSALLKEKLAEVGPLLGTPVPH